MENIYDSKSKVPEILSTMASCGVSIIMARSKGILFLAKRSSNNSACSSDRGNLKITM